MHSSGVNKMNEFKKNMITHSQSIDQLIVLFLSSQNTDAIYYLYSLHFWYFSSRSCKIMNEYETLTREHNAEFFNIYGKIPELTSNEL